MYQILERLTYVQLLLSRLFITLSHTPPLVDSVRQRVSNTRGTGVLSDIRTS
jgi:hypothetical protein